MHGNEDPAHRQKGNQTTQIKMGQLDGIGYSTTKLETLITPSGGYFIRNRHPHELLMKV